MKDLNENHIRVLRSGFNEIENALHKFLSLLKKDESYSGDLSGIESVIKSIDNTQKVLTDARDKLGIRKSRKSAPMWIIRVGVARLWEMLEDMKSKNLRGYGKISSEMAPVLDKQVDRLIVSIEEIAKAAENAGRE